ncbi:MAG: transposase [Saprospiraceae bacterium]|nr:transposase [Saprospiraceae bacterium]
MIGKLLTTSEKELVEELRGNTRDKFSYMKLSVLILLDMGKDYDEVVAILGIGRGTISNCLQKYRADGLDKYLDKHYVPYSGKMSDEQLGRVDSEVSAGVFTSLQQVRDFIEKAFGLGYSLSAVRGILEKLGFVYRKTSEVPCRFSEAEQEAFLEQFVPFLEETPEDETVSRAATRCSPRQRMVKTPSAAESRSYVFSFWREHQDKARRQKSLCAGDASIRESDASITPPTSAVASTPHPFTCFKNDCIASCTWQASNTFHCTSRTITCCDKNYVFAVLRKYNVHLARIILIGTSSCC